MFILTWFCISGVATALARLYFPDQEQDTCQVNDVPGGRFRPDCHAVTKMFESPWVDSDYNDCGFRSDRPCKTEDPDALRIAVLGTSIARGYWVPFDESFGGRLEHDLTSVCQRNVDLQNLALADAIDATPNGWIPLWHHVADRVPAALALHPRALVLVMSAFDLASYDAMPNEGRALPPQEKPRGLSGMVKTVKHYVANDSRLVLVLRHIAYRNADRYVLHELAQGDSTAYLRQPFTHQWSLRLKVADYTIQRIAAQAHAAGVPLIVALMPSRAQAALSAPNVDRHHAKPFALGGALAAVTRAHGANFIDVTEAMSHVTDPASFFYAVNGHPNAAGDGVLSRTVEAALKRDVPDFRRCGGSQS